MPKRESAHETMSRVSRQTQQRVSLEDKQRILHRKRNNNARRAGQASVRYSLKAITQNCTVEIGAGRQGKKKERKSKAMREDWGSWSKSFRLAEAMKERKLADTTALTSCRDTEACLDTQRHHLVHEEPRLSHLRQPMGSSFEDRLQCIADTSTGGGR